MTRIYNGLVLFFHTPFIDFVYKNVIIFDTDQYLDLSIEANRRKFMSWKHIDSYWLVLK